MRRRCQLVCAVGKQLSVLGDSVVRLFESPKTPRFMQYFHQLKIRTGKRRCQIVRAIGENYLSVWTALPGCLSHRKHLKL